MTKLSDTLLMSGIKRHFGERINNIKGSDTYIDLNIYGELHRVDLDFFNKIWSTYPLDKFEISIYAIDSNTIGIIIEVKK